MNTQRTSRNVLVLAMVMAAFLLGFQLAVGTPVAKASTFELEGIVESIPPGFQGTWIIGGVEFTTNPATEFDEVDGPLVVGGCADVEVVGGLVREIDSEPLRDCL